MIQRDESEANLHTNLIEAEPHKSKFPELNHQKIAFDECSIRVMFMEMDADASGTITKEEFINYIRSRPQMQNVMYSALKPDASPQASPTSSPQASRVMGIKRIIALYKAVDKEGHGSATWDEFLDLFRRTGLLITYTTPNNPRDRLAGALANEYQRRQSGVNSRFSLDQKQQQFSSQWAAERRSQVKDQQDSIDALMEASRSRCQLTVKTGARQIDTKPEGNQSMHKEGPSPTPMSPTPMSPTLPCVWKPQSLKRKGTDLDSAIKEAESKPLPDIEPLSPSVKLPAIRQPISPKGRSDSAFCERRPCSEKSPRKISSRRHVESRRSTPPSRRGRTPRQSEFVHQVLCVN